MLYTYLCRKLGFGYYGEKDLILAIKSRETYIIDRFIIEIIEDRSDDLRLSYKEDVGSFFRAIC